MIVNDTKFNIRMVYNPLGSTRINSILKGGDIDKDKLLIGNEEHFTYKCDGEQNTYAKTKRRKMSMLNDATTCITEIGADNQPWTEVWTDPTKAYDICKKITKVRPNDIMRTNDWVSLFII